MNTKSKILLCSVLAFSISAAAFAKHDKSEEKSGRGLSNAVVLIIRHAEKPDSGPYLAPEGQKRAQLYSGYFKNYSIDSKPLVLDGLFATADSRGSQRPRLTITPLANSLGMRVNTPFKDDQYQDLANMLRASSHGTHILICWHHGKIPEPVQALGADPAQVIPGSKWPANVFSWVIQLRYDDKGRLIDATRINENLMPDDASKSATQ